MARRQILLFLGFVSSVSAFGIGCRCSPPSQRTVVSAEAGAGDQEGHAMQSYFEETAQKGADAVKQMSIAERTRRAMLAEAVEDRICENYDDLEAILGEDGVLPEDEEEKRKVTEIAQQIKALQDDYSALVNGEKSQYLEGFDFDKK